MSKKEIEKIKNTDNLVKNINQMKQKGCFKSYISKIIFPFYKNFEEDSVINFTFPLTVFVGKNGSGKSSLLHALYGCPYKHSIREYWFSTATDPIKDGNGRNKRHSLIYTYDGISSKTGKYKSNQQVLLHRGSRPGTKTKKRDPDYWETAKPEKRYGMSEKRCSPIKERVKLLDFRQQLSAYDKFFYFGNVNDLKTNTRQNFIRRVSPKLEKAIDDQKIYLTNKRKQNNKVEVLKDEELEIISYILNGKYESAKLLKHKFYREWGYSALVKKDKVKYTEAHAGSGEYAIIKLVHELSKINRPTLILLDEPETSLYPGAQERLLNYLLRIIETTQSQVVISTHSERFISKLPPSAIKAVHYDSKTRKSSIIEDCSPSTVFSDLEVPITSKFKIIVEDIAAEKLLAAVIKEEKIPNLIVKNIGCGADYLKSNSILQSALSKDDKVYYYLDGDQYLDKNELNIEGILSLDGEKNLQVVDRLVKKISTGISFPSSKPRSSENRKIVFDKIKYKAELRYLDFFKKNVFFLPADDPETIIYDANVSSRLLKAVMSKYKVDERKKAKEKIYSVAKAMSQEGISNASQYYAYLNLFITAWIQKKDANYKEIVVKLKNISKKFKGL